MTKRNWLERAWNKLNGLTEQDFQTGELLSSITGLEWETFRSWPEGGELRTRYRTIFSDSKTSEAVCKKLNESLYPESESFEACCGVISIAADSINGSALKEGVDFAKMKKEIADIVNAVEEKRRNTITLPKYVASL